MDDAYDEGLAEEMYMQQRKKTEEVKKEIDYYLYPRILRCQMESEMDKQVSIVGRIIKCQRGILTLETGQNGYYLSSTDRGHVSYLEIIFVQNFNAGNLEEGMSFVEIRGTVKSSNTIDHEESNPFGDDNFSKFSIVLRNLLQLGLELYNKMVELMWKEEFRSLNY